MSIDDDDDSLDPAEAIERRIERLRRMRGWASDAPKEDAPKAAAPKAEPPKPVVMQDTEKPQERPEDAMWLRYSDPQRGRAEVEVDRDHFEIGSGERVHLRIMDPSLSARHCRISWDDGGYRVRDMNSKNGTLVNGQAVRLSHPLVDGDVLTAGALKFDVTVRSPSASVESEKTAFVPLGSAKMPTPAAPPPRTPSMRMEAVRAEPTPRPPPKPEAPRGEPAIAAYVLLHRDLTGQPIETRILKGQTLLVGRAATANLRLNEGSVSNRHATVSWGTDTFGADAQHPMVKDLGSSNGTFVNQARVQQSLLKDGDELQFGRYPMRVGVVRLAPAPAPEPEPEEIEEEVEVAPPDFHVVYLDEHGILSCVTLSETESVLGVGTAAEIRAPASSGLAGEHATFTWDQGVLLIEGVGGEIVTVSGVDETSAVLKNGDVVALAAAPDQAPFRLRIVRSLPVAAHRHESPNIEATVAAWAQFFEELDPDLELQFIDHAASELIEGAPEGSRLELVLWGDGVVQLDVKQEQESLASRPGRMHHDVLVTLASALSRAGFPDTHHLGDPTSKRGRDPEVHVFRGKHRADVVLGQRLTTRSGAYAEVRDLLRAIAAEIAED